MVNVSHDNNRSVSYDTSFSEHTGIGLCTGQHNVQDAEGVEDKPAPEASSAASSSNPNPQIHISLLEGVDVYFVEDDFVFFNINDIEPTVKDLDKSYRQLAIKMHPDKHGGSVQAKEAFQYLQMRYERLRAAIRRALIAT